MSTGKQKIKTKKDAIRAYEQFFGERFPLMSFMGASDEAVIRKVKEAIECGYMYIEGTQDPERAQ